MSPTIVTHIRFSDLRSGGRVLAAALGAWHAQDDATVLGIARGGVPAAVEVARALSLPLDVIVPRRLIASRDDGTATCAVRIAGHLYLDPELEMRIADTGTGARAGIDGLLAELEQREAMCRVERTALDIARRTVLLVDNGIHTGATMRVVIRALRTMSVGRIVVAAPAAAPSALPAIRRAADDVVTLEGTEPFGHVGMWYQRLDVPDFANIAPLLAEADASYLHSTS